jgi:tRNA G26 N,N-dimethylase Trm1
MPEMTYLHCRRCRLAIRCRAHYVLLSTCPRCLARAAIVSPLFASPLDDVALHAAAEPCAQQGTTAGADPGQARSRS